VNTTKVSFGDVVQLAKERSKDPEADGFDRFVGLEHIDPGELRIRRWGNIADGVTFTSVFRPGQVLFGKRRAYQRKVAVADFSGVCSGDIYVLEPKGKHLLPELLPFLCQTNAFFEHAVGTSAGSLSPRTNWKSLSDFEFALPPIEEQRRMVEVLNLTERAIESMYELVSASLAAEAALAEDFIQQNPPDTTLDEVLESIAYGTSERASDDERGVPVLRIPNITSGTIDLEEMSDADEARYRVNDGDVLIVRTNGNPDYVGRCVVARNLPRTFAYASYLIRIRVSSQLLVPEFLTSMLNSPRIRRVMRGSIRSSAGNYNLNTKGIRRQTIPLPTIDKQWEFLHTHAASRAGSERAKRRMRELRELQSILLQHM